MEDTVRDKVCTFKEHGVGIARVSSSPSTAPKKAIISVSSKSIYIKKELEINEPFLLHIPGYGLKSIKLMNIESSYIDVSVDEVTPAINLLSLNGVSNKPVDEDLKSYIRSEIGNVEELVLANTELTQELKDDFIEHTKYVKGSLDHLGQKDALILLIGLAGNFASGAVFAPGVAIEMASSLSTCLPHIFNVIVHGVPIINSETLLLKDS